MDKTNELLDDENVENETLNDTKKYDRTILIRKPKRAIVVEPILINIALFYFPLRQVTQLFIYGRMKHIVASENGYNTSIFSVLNSSSTSCDENKSTIQYQLTEQAQQYNTYFSMIGSVINFIPSLFVLLLVGAYSDKAGRKYAILPPIIAGFVFSGMHLLVFVLNLPVWVLWIGEFLNGCSGSMSLLIAGCFSYIADTTTKENRQFRITFAEISMFFCTILGPIGVGYVIDKEGYLWPFVIVFIGHILNLIYTLFFVPETIIKDRSAKLFTLENIKLTFKTFTINTPDNRRWKLWLLFISFFVHYIGSGVYAVTGLFVLNIPLCWDAVTIGYYNTALTALSTVGGIATAKIMKYFTSDAMIALVTSFVDGINCIYKGFVQNTAMMFACEYNITSYIIL